MKPVIITILLLLFAGSKSFSQGWVVEENNFETNWNITLQIGRTALLSEVNTNFRGSSNDMNNLSDWGFNLQVGKMVWDRFDLGFEFGISNYKGYKNNSSNVNYLMYHYFYNNEESDFQPYTIYYDSGITNFTVFAKYSFINFNTWSRGYLKLNMYLKLGVGIAFPSSELGFSDEVHYVFTGLKHPLYLKGRYPSPSKDSHNFFNPAVGLNYQLSERIFFSAEASFQMIGADNIDGVHNYNNQLRPDVPRETIQDYRVRVYALTAKFMVGATYFFNFDSHKQARIKQMPWFSNRYRSYYSKFHKTSPKKARQDRLPFYKDDFNSN